MTEFGPKVHRNISLPAGTHQPEVIRRTYSESDAEINTNVTIPSGASSSSSLSSKSNESGNHVELAELYYEYSEEEENTEPWSAKAPADLLANLSHSARKRQDLIHELITTEISHLRWLSILGQIFFENFERSNLLSQNEVTDIFPNFPDVLMKHHKLCSNLKQIAAASPTVKIKPLADALIITFSDLTYSKALSKFCKGQRLALDVLRERQKRNKDLHAFITKLEQEPVCARRRLQDFLACVWQRLTKYQLLLEGIINTKNSEDDPDNLEEEGFARISEALRLAKENLHNVDKSIKNTENEHRLKLIKSKLEIRDNDLEDVLMIDPKKNTLVMEGSLIIRQDSTKRITVHALMLKEFLVLLHKESDRYILRNIPQGFPHNISLNPVIHWNRVFLRTNASVKNGFFLVDINGKQMYEISTTNSTEYNMWVRHLSQFAEGLRPTKKEINEEGPPPPPLPANPPPVMTSQRDNIIPDIPPPNVNADEEKKEEELEPPPNEDDKNEVDKNEISVSRVQSIKENETFEDKVVNSIKFSENELITPTMVDVSVPPIMLTAVRQFSPEEHLRQAEMKVINALKEASEAAKTVFNTPTSLYMAMENVLNKSRDDNLYRMSLGNGLNNDHSDLKSNEIPFKQLIINAQSHVDNLTEILFRALRVSPVDCSMSKCSVHTKYGLCDACFANYSNYSSTKTKCNISKNGSEVVEKEEIMTENELAQNIVDNFQQTDNNLDSFITLEEAGESSTDPNNESDLHNVTSSFAALRNILTTLSQRIPVLEQDNHILRARLQQADERIHQLHHQLPKEALFTEEGKEIMQEVPKTISTNQSGDG